MNKVNVEITRKKIKNVHLKVNRDLKVTLSLPYQVPNEWIDKFLNDRIEWISKQLQKYKQSSGHNNLTNIKSETSTQLLGKDRRIIKQLSDKDYIVENEKNIMMYVTNLEDCEKHQLLLEKWWREKAYQIYSQEADRLYDKIFKKYNVAKPQIYIRKMKTLWGSCIPAKSKITLNEYLLKADLRCIQYVVLHELTHLIYIYHNKDFYDFLTIQMPDWKVVKEQLDKEVVQGL